MPTRSAAEISVVEESNFVVRAEPLVPAVRPDQGRAAGINELSTPSEPLLVLGWVEAQLLCQVVDVRWALSESDQPDVCEYGVVELV